MKRVLKVHDAVKADMDELTTWRAIPTASIEHLDPFLFLNHHGHQIYPPGNEGLPFGPHPHRGFETVTLILEGALTHSDSGGHVSEIGPGGVQWMTAGRGIIHSELSPESFRKNGGPLEILQIWVNLPARLKMTDTHYVGLQSDGVPKALSEDKRVVAHVVAGDWDEVRGPVRSLTGLHLAWLEMKKGGTAVRSVPEEANVFFYVARGQVRVNGSEAGIHQLVEFAREGDFIRIEALEDSVIVFGHGVPFDEPIVSYGPFVMNTQEEIHQAIMDFQSGRFG
jgi:redox-sensitive bicupin YhaK (pirin superfamily)